MSSITTIGLSRHKIRVRNKVFSKSGPFLNPSFRARLSYAAAEFHTIRHGVVLSERKTGK